jgi:hypothetical protein
VAPGAVGFDILFATFFFLRIGTAGLVAGTGAGTVMSTTLPSIPANWPEVGMGAFI